jgi:para-aminobenzoate synthetase component 1
MKVRVEKLPLDISPREALERLLQLSHPVLLESALKEKEIGRYSLLSAEPFLILKNKDAETTLYKNGKKEKKLSQNPFDAVEEHLRKYEISEQVDLPFAGGAIGYFSYDLNQHLEKLPNWAQDDLNLPHLYLAFYDWGILYDHFKKETLLIYLENREAVDKALQIKKTLLEGNKGEDPLKVYPKKVKLKSNFSQKGYLEAVKKAKEYIFNGDIFQVNLSQRLEAPLFLSPFSLYKVLQEINPSPFAAFLGFEDSTIVSSSPERFLKVKNGEVETRPIKGTRPRGKNPQEEEKLYWELFFSEKDRAENVMIVDLERNDLGKVCEVGSVKVRELFRVEKYATVLHLVSIVKGTLRENVSLIDLLKATFPGGSITGAPKVRAMEIIEELEPTKRNVYTGSIGYLSFNKRMDLNIAIRTFIVKEDTAFFQVGGGIVADSDPEAEYQETMDKAKALIESIKRCE